MGYKLYRAPRYDYQNICYVHKYREYMVNEKTIYFILSKLSVQYTMTFSPPLSSKPGAHRREMNGKENYD